jgi:hypothetical protein
MLGTRWTKEQENYLKDNYDILGAKLCSINLNKSKGSIYEKAKRLGLSGKSLDKTNEQYLTELDARTNLLVYPIETYSGARVPILHRCINDHEFKAAPYSILSSISTGCKICSRELLKTTHEEYVNKAPFLVLEPYVDSNTPIKHQCSSGHIWSPLPSQVLFGKGCPSCAKGGFDPNKPGTLYYIKIAKANLSYYKIGITNRTIAARFKDEDKNTVIKVIHQTHYENGADAREEETRLLREFKSYRQNIPELLKSGGNTELFEFDVLGLDI